jgi:lipoyl(octanoyl) transferase
VSTPLAWRWLGRLAYEPALLAQRERRRAILAGQEAEEIWLLEHQPVVTIGRREPADLDRDALARQGLAVVPTERGGLATWHGPGQLVAYTLVRVQGRGFGPRSFVCAVENTVIAWLGERGVEAGRRPGLPGIWVGQDKICAIGLHMEGGVAMHGLALNLSPALEPFGLFTPCGIRDGGVTSLRRLRGSAPSPEEAASSLGPALSASLRLDLSCRG